MIIDRNRIKHLDNVVKNFRAGMPFDYSKNCRHILNKCQKSYMKYNKIIDKIRLTAIG